MEGIPTATMGDPEENQRRGGRGFGHTMYDTVDKVQVRSIRECVANSALAAVRLVNADNWPVNHRTPQEIDQLVEEQGYKEAAAIGEKLTKYLTSKADQLTPAGKAYLIRLSSDAGWKEVL